MDLSPQHQSFKILLLLYTSSSGLRPKHKQGPIPNPRLTFDLGFSLRAAPRRHFRYVGTIEEELGQEDGVRRVGEGIKLSVQGLREVRTG